MRAGCSDPYLAGVICEGSEEGLGALLANFVATEVEANLLGGGGMAVDKLEQSFVLLVPIN